MKFEFTPEEARTVAEAVRRWLVKRTQKVSIETRMQPNAPYLTTLLGKRGAALTLVEAQGSCKYDGALQRFATWLAAQRVYAELYLATSEDSDVPARILTAIADDGVGLLLVDDSMAVRCVKNARNFALLVTPDPTLALGRQKTVIRDLVDRFNEGDRKDALRDMCELVERETDRLIRLGVRKGWITVAASRVDRMDWNKQINVLASSAQCAPGKAVIISHAEKADFHSFRNARNLLDHKVKNKREEHRREQQFAERMMQGPRLMALLLAMQRRIR